ncbi:helix-turn-helix domain-containing protein [Brevundimonas sp. 2R-24]|uniref:Helix-turn-helix domain-containing protein n=1 Tax=Peiella sedimenti TaxID=3061083 RepID=A0ABT8SP91_9CAUL|nr:helix-turn-helix domain-containing protein [Caulobacteraceae bacterium XZ-24]
MSTPGERLREKRREMGLSAADLAARVGRSEAAVRNQENGTNGIPAGLAVKYAAILGTSVGYLLDGVDRKRRDERVVPRFLPVRHRVAGGLWYEVDEFAQDFPEPPRAIVPDDRYAEWPQWLELVQGDSVDKRIAPGGYAHVVDAIEMGYKPKEGDLVVVERRRSGGQIRERTIKEVKLNGRGVELWPCSNNPKWSTPVVLGGDDEDVEAEIVGKVIGAYVGF